MSDASSVSGEAAQSSSETADAYKLSRRIHACLAAHIDAPFTIAMLRKASVMMTCLRDRLTEGEALSQTGKTLLMCAGICCFRRFHSGSEEETERGLVWKTTALLFVLLVLAEGPIEDPPPADCGMFSDSILDAFPKVGSGVAPTEDSRLLDAWRQAAAADSAFGLAGAHASSMGEGLQSNPAISRAALAEARRLGAGAAMSDFSELAGVFFKASAAAAVNSLIQKREPDFISLESAGVVSSSLENRDELLSAIVAAAESESGQAVLRDLILSFKLPQSALGVRRTLLLPRSLNALITSQHTDLLNAAHEAAMRGAEWSWNKDGDLVHKAAALLAGYAVVTAKSQDSIRKGDAFGGRVCLPFLECRPPKNFRVPRLVMLSGGEFAVFTTDSGGQPRVLLKQSGFGGLCVCVLYLSKVRPPGGETRASV